jgi:integrase
MRYNLTERAVRSLPLPEQGQRTYFDEDVIGFGVRVSQGGAKTYTLMYGPERKLEKLGQFPVVALAEARERARQILAARTLGLHQRNSRVRFEEGYQLFIRFYRAKNRSKTVYEMERIVNRHLMLKFKRCKLSSISINDLSLIIENLLDTPSECQATFKATRTIFRWLERRRLIGTSPMAGLEAPHRYISRDRILTDRELKAVYLAASDGSIFGNIVRLLILTGQRRGQILRLQGEFVDKDTGLISWPAPLMKSNRLHTLPLAPIAAAIVSEYPSNGLLFRARGKESPFNGFSKSKLKLDQNLKAVAPWTLHDLRRTFSTGLARLRVAPHVKEMILGHVSGRNSMELIYDRYLYHDEMREALENWEQYVEKIPHFI